MGNDVLPPSGDNCDADPRVETDTAALSRVTHMAVEGANAMGGLRELNLAGYFHFGGNVLDVTPPDPDRIYNAEQVAMRFWKFSERMRCATHSFSKEVEWDSLPPERCGRMVAAFDKLITEDYLELGPQFRQEVD